MTKPTQEQIERVAIAIWNHCQELGEARLDLDPTKQDCYDLPQAAIEAMQPEYQDKYEAAADVLERYDYTLDDLAKLLCRVYGRNVKATGNDKSKMRQVIFGEGSKFILRINMLPQEAHETQWDDQ